MSINIPNTLRTSVGTSKDGCNWLAALPNLISSLAREWNLDLSEPFSDEVTGSWVALCRSPQGPAVLKVGFPHFEADYETDGLVAWNGGCTVHLFNADKSHYALLLERCDPGTALRSCPAPEQDSVIAQLCQELWQTPAPLQIRSLSKMIEQWCNGSKWRYHESRKTNDNIDFRLADQGLAELERLANSQGEQTLLATDLHAGNVLASSRRPWLVIDPKPHIGDPCYDLTQHLMNNKPRIASNGPTLIEDLATQGNVNADRLLRWTFGRLCLNSEDLPLARELATYL